MVNDSGWSGNAEETGPFLMRRRGRAEDAWPASETRGKRQDRAGREQGRSEGKGEAGWGIIYIGKERWLRAKARAKRCQS